MPTEVATQALPLGDAAGIVTHHSGYSVPTFGEVPEKEPYASAPVIDSVAAPTQTAGILVLDITLPTTDTDGDVLAESEIVRIRMHHSTSPGVDVNDSYVDFPPGETIQWGPGDVVAHYVAIRVKDSHENWSALSNEVSGTANEAASTEPEDAGLWAHRLGVDAIWTEDSPDTNSVAWANVVLYWKDQKYEITDGNTNKTFIWWDHNSTTTFQYSDTKPTLTFEDVLVATTDAGKLYLMIYSPMVIADFIRAGVLQSKNWAAAEGSEFDLDAGTLKLGGSSSPAFSVNAAGEVDATAGTIGGWTLGATTLTGGNLTLDAGNTKITAGAGQDIIVIDAAHAAYRLFIGETDPTMAPFRVTKAGVLTASGATIAGALTTGGGSSIGGTYIDALGVGKLTSGTIESQSIVLGITGTDDCEIRAGIATGDFTNAGENQGFIIGLDYSDSSKAKFYFGGPDANDLDRHMQWTGSVLSVSADLVCTDDFLFSGLISKHISYADFTGAGLDDMTTNSEDDYGGTVERDYRVRIDLAAATDTFEWSHDGGASYEDTDIPIAGVALTTGYELEENVKITFGAATGHTATNYWDFSVGDKTTNIHNMAGVYQIFASTLMPATDTRIKLDGYGLGGGIDLYSGPAAESHVNLHAEGSISLDASGGA